MAFLFLFQALMGDLFEGSFSSEQLLIFHFLNLPQILVQMMPPAIILSTVLTLSGLARTSELIACLSIGIGIKRIAFLLLSLVFIISCLTLIFQDRIVPPSFKKRTVYYWHTMKKKNDFYLDLKQDKIWYRSKNLIYNLQFFDARTNTIKGMSVHTFDPQFNLVQVIEAEKAEYLPAGWRLMNGTVTVFSEKDHFPQTQRFTSKNLNISETPTDFQEIEKEVKGLRIKELYHYIRRMKLAGADTKAYEVEFHSKFSLSFIPMIMCALGIPFSITSRRQSGVAKDFGLCLGVTFFYWLFYSVGLSLGKNGAIAPVFAAWLPSGIFAIIAIVLLVRLQK